MNRSKPLKRRKKMIAVFFGGSIVLIILLIVICNIRVKQYSSGKTFDEIADVPACKTGLLLGTASRLSDGSPNPYFQYRIEAATELYKAGKIKYIIASGDNHTGNYNEPEEMKEALRKAGVPEHVIYPDFAGFRTLDSVVRAKEIFGQDTLTIISQHFHNERAIFLASRFGIHAIGYNAGDVPQKIGIQTNIRELFARVKVFIDLFTQKQPKYLGEPIDLP